MLYPRLWTSAASSLVWAAVIALPVYADDDHHDGGTYSIGLWGDLPYSDAAGARSACRT